jgi:hypothetical protein
MVMSRKFFYLLIFLGIVVALFFSAIVGLAIVVGDVVYFFYYSRRKPLEITTSNFAGNRGPVMQERTKLPCKFCGTMLDPANDGKCPNCGAPIDA